MTDYRGLTWDHPRGYRALRAAASRLDGTGSAISWDAQPLEAFEAHPIDELAARYDLLVLDHPHLGVAVAADCLTPLEELFGAAELAGWAAASLGPTMRSYHYAGRQWALPLDAATQVCATRPDLAGDPPRSWSEVLGLAARAPVALCMAGPHALLSFASICVALGEPPARQPDLFISTDTGLAGLELMATLAARAPAGVAELNPIGLLERMAHSDDIAAIPLVYGYVTYAGRIRFSAAPTARPGGPCGSTLGGTGLAVSRSCVPTAALLAHLRWLLSEPAQRTFLPTHSGQPSATSAWQDPDVDSAAAGFYSGTADTVRGAWVRPRHAGYLGFQSAGSALLRDILTGALDHRTGLARLGRLYRDSHRRLPELHGSEPRR